VADATYSVLIQATLGGKGGSQASPYMAPIRCADRTERGERWVVSERQRNGRRVHKGFDVTGACGTPLGS